MVRGPERVRDDRPWCWARRHARGGGRDRLRVRGRRPAGGPADRGARLARRARRPGVGVGLRRRRPRRAGAGAALRTARRLERALPRRRADPRPRRRPAGACARGALAAGLAAGARHPGPAARPGTVVLGRGRGPARGPVPGRGGPPRGRTRSRGRPAGPRPRARRLGRHRHDRAGHELVRSHRHRAHPFRLVSQRDRRRGGARRQGRPGAGPGTSGPDDPRSRAAE